MIGDGNITVAIRLITGSNGSTTVSKGDNICIAFNADIRCISTITTADTCAVITAAGSDLTAGDGNVGSIGKFSTTAADGGRIMEAACQKFAGSVLIGTGLCSTIIVHIVLDGQGAGAVYVCFFNTGVV